MAKEQADTNIKPGSYVKIETRTKKGTAKIVEGLLLPTEDDAHTFVKLNDGYNWGIENNSIIKIEEIKKESKTPALKEHKEPSKAKTAENPKLPLISILHTGGTIASKVDYRTGAVVSSFNPEELIAMFPELKNIANIHSSLISNMFSDDVRFAHIKKIAAAVQQESEQAKKESKKLKGIIIGIGTDNLAVVSAALAFAFEDINIPVLFVGAQRSSDRGSTDAAMNMICAAEFIAKTDYKGVAICMHSTSSDKECSILPACKTKKLHTSRRDAFKAVNDSEIARIDYETRKITMKKTAQEISEDQKIKGEKIILKSNFEEKVGILKIHVNMHPEEFSAYKNFKGLIIEGTGLGHTPLHVPDKEAEIHNEIKNEIKKLNEKGIVMIMTSNCIFGRVGMNVYSKGRDLQQLGVIPGEDMLTDTAFVKLAWLLGNHRLEEAKKLVRKNLRGEILGRTGYEEEILKE